MLYPRPALGTSSFSWTVNENEAMKILDYFHERGGGIVDTADMYGNSEEFIGKWIKNNPIHNFRLPTKVGALNNSLGLSCTNVKSGVLRSIERLNVTNIDIYFCHIDDPEMSVGEIFETFQTLKEEGLINVAGISNFSLPRARELLNFQRSSGIEIDIFRFIQGPFNLIDRRFYTEDLLPILKEFNLSFMPFYPLAKGFLSGAYKSDDSESKYMAGHGGIGVLEYHSSNNFKLLNVIQEISLRHECTFTQVALSWLMQQAKVFVPIVGFRTLDQAIGSFDLITFSDEEIIDLNQFKSEQPKLAK